MARASGKDRCREEINTLRHCRTRVGQLGRCFSPNSSPNGTWTWACNGRPKEFGHPQIGTTGTTLACAQTYVRTYVRTHNCRVPILSVLSFGFSDLNARTPYVTVRQMSERSPRAPAKSAHVRAYLLNQASARVRT